jgi:hypothetical protein
VPTNQHCLLCNPEPLLHIFAQNSQAKLTPAMEQDIDLLPCLMAIVNVIQSTFAYLPF